MTALLWAGDSNNQPPGGSHASMILWPTCLQKSSFEYDLLNDSAWKWAGVSCSAKATVDQSYYGIFLIKVLPWGKNSTLYLKVKYNLWSFCKFIQYRQNIFSPLPNCTLFKFTIWTSTSCIVKSEKITISMQVTGLSTATQTLTKYYCIIKSAGDKTPVFSYLVLFITRTRNDTEMVLIQHTKLSCKAFSVILCSIVIY